MSNFYTIVRKNGGTIAWTDEQVAYIIDKYVNKNYTLKQLGQEFGCAYGTIRSLLNKHHIQSRGCKQGYPRNEFYFNKIDTREKAYWLGFLYADGCVHSTGYEISIQLIDQEHLEKFKNAIGAVNHKIGSYEDKRWKNAKTLYSFSIKDKQLYKDLCFWGCVPRKSLILKDFPNIPYNFMPDFIRGYFDGDGSLHYLQGTNNYRMSFVGTKEFLQNIKDYFNLNMTISQNEGNNSFYIQIAGRKQVEKVLNILYQDSTEQTRLDRKYNTYLKCLEWAHRH